MAVLKCIALKPGLPTFSNTLLSTFFYELFKSQENTPFCGPPGPFSCINMLRDVRNESHLYENGWSCWQSAPKGQDCYSQLVCFSTVKDKHSLTLLSLPFLMKGGYREAGSCLPPQCQQLAQSSLLPERVSGR